MRQINILAYMLQCTRDIRVLGLEISLPFSLGRLYLLRSGGVGFVAV